MLRKRDYSDTSLITVFYTEDFGKLQFIIKGAKSLKKNSSVSFEHGSCYEIQFRHRPAHSGLTLLRDAHLIEWGLQIRQDIQKFYHLAYGIELLDAFTELEEKDHVLFDIALGMIQGVNALDNTALCLRSFETRLLDHAGFLVDVENCSGCQKRFSDACFLDYQAARLLCGQCRPASALTFSPQDLKSILLFRRGEMSFLTDREHFQIQKLLWFCIDFHLGKPLKSRQFVRNFEPESKASHHL